jgi:hypothetical protein
MEHSQSLTARQVALERVADRLLETFPDDPERPAYSERRLARRGSGWMRSINSLAVEVVAEPQEFRDELRFLMSVTRLRPEIRRCLRLWVDGWSQYEIAEAYRVAQQTISYRLRTGLRACYESVPLSFRRYSYHSIYRRPHKGPELGLVRICVHCEEVYLMGLGAGRYCSERCRNTSFR